MTKHAPACLSSARGAQFFVVARFTESATLNVPGLSLPDQTRAVARRHLIGCSYLFIARW
jgi:hypothetical protein